MKPATNIFDGSEQISFNVPIFWIEPPCMITIRSVKVMALI